MTWDYAELSKAAKVFGGPEKLVEHIVAVSKKSGRIEMIPFIFGALFVGGVIGGTVTKTINYLQMKKSATQTELEATKAAIINEMKEYEASHPEKMTSDHETTHQDEPSDE